MQQFFTDMTANMQTMNAWLAQHPVIGFLVLAWLFAWKGLALWKAARRSDLIWFVALFLINLFSVLEILYFFIFSERKGLKEKK